ncbi:hypothetical protein DFH28DRAFT_888500 [Melampsora americana]|nr:hypothetical protein DFH28DRAFT_888500 [Melampsora americana]
MAEPVHIEHGHAKWISNIREAFRREAIGQYKVFREEYQFWCENEGTEPRDIEMVDFTYGVESRDPEILVGGVKEKPRTRVESNTNMIIGTLPSTNMIGLSQYFHEIMINKNIHMPVSIFDPTWLIQDANFMKTRSARTGCSTNTMAYVGLPYVNEYRLTQNEWSTRFNLMVKYQEEKYDVLDSQKLSPIAPRLRVHKENVLQIQINCYGKWTPAMRYDIAHRRNVWENRLPDGSMADVGTLNTELAERAKEDAKHFLDWNYIDNPYAFGSVMQNVSPINGETYPEHASWDSSNALVDTHADMLTGRSLSSISNQPVTQNLSNNPRTNNTGKFKGKYFNPLYERPTQYHPAPYHYPNPYSNHFSGGGEFVPNHNGHRGLYRGGGRGSRGGRGGGTGRGSSIRPVIGPGSFDRSLGLAGRKVNGGAVNEASTGPK